MKKAWFFLTIVLPINVVTGNQFFRDANIFFKTYVDEKGRVDYAAIKAAPLGLNYVVSNIAFFPLNLQDSVTRKAYWINTYNILMVKAIVDHYPVSKPTDITNIFSDDIYNAAGKRVSLDLIEQKILGSAFPDPRVNFALCRASLGSPRLANFAFIPQALDAQLEERAKLFMNYPGFIRVNPGKKMVLISEIFEWRKTDFELAGTSLIQFVNRFRTEQIPIKYSIGFYDFDWTLNDKKTGTGSIFHWYLPGSGIPGQQYPVAGKTFIAWAVFSNKQREFI